MLWKKGKEVRKWLSGKEEVTGEIRKAESRSRNNYRVIQILSLWKH